MLTIICVKSQFQIDQARSLFREYEAWLGLDLCFQGFEEELAGLPGKYARPDGRLLLAFWNEELAGCVALRKLDDVVGEVKRLFVRDEFRGLRIGNYLIEHLIVEAREIGYSKLRLDTYPAKMEKAVRLYQSHGFFEIEPYYENPHDGVLFMEQTL